MKYNGFYFWLFSRPMKKVLAEKYSRKYADEIMKKSKPLYRRLVEEADDIGADNPMAYNELFALAFVAPYLASEKQIPPETVQLMMERSLYYVKWYTAKKEEAYPNSFKVDFEGQPHENACYYRITRCPICAYCKKINAGEVMPLLCELDHVMITLQHGVLHREQTIAGGGSYCDYYITGDREYLR